MTHFNKLWLPACLTLLIPLPFLAAQGPQLSTDEKGRQILRDERPDDSRGWVVIAKSTYWPLCYEALDRLEQARELVGQGKDEQLADTLDKCTAWLGLAASAAMTDGKAGIVQAQELLEDAAAGIRDGSNVYNDTQLKSLITLGELCMAKSHVLRASAPDDNYKATYAGAKDDKDSNEQSEAVRTARGQIEAENTKARVAQYRYDALQSYRHISVADDYLEAAAKSGEFELPESISERLPEFTDSEHISELADEFATNVRPRMKEMMTFIDQQRADLIKRIQN